MRTLISIILFLICIVTNAQVDLDTKAILLKEKILLNLDTKILYTNEIDSFHVLLILQRLNYPIYKYKIDSITESPILASVTNSSICIDSIVLTNDEKKVVYKELYNREINDWISNFLQNSKFISGDIISSIFSDDSKRWDYFHKKFGSCFFTLSKPIFLRNKTICLSYASQTCDLLGGHGALFIFIKTNGSWEFFSETCDWIS